MSSDQQPQSNEQIREDFINQAGITPEVLMEIQRGSIKRQTRSRKQTPLKHQTNSYANQKLPPANHHTLSQAKHNRVNQEFKIQTPKKQPRQLSTSHNHKIKDNQESKITSNSIPNSPDQFNQSYQEFSLKLTYLNQNDRKFIQQKGLQLYEILIKTIQEGGIADVIAQGRKVEIFTPFLQKFNVQSTDEIFNIYKKYLFHFQYFRRENYTQKVYKDATNFFQQATFVSQEELKKFIDQDSLNPKYFNQDILVFRNGQNVLGVDSQKISLDKVSKCYQNHLVDIRIQKGLDYGFKPKTMTNQPYQMKISDYRKYQKLCQQYQSQNAPIDQQFLSKLQHLRDLDINGKSFQERLQLQQILFAVNFDPDDGILVNHIAEKVKDTFFGYKQPFDLLSYLDQEIPGCSFPQFYMKVKGVWTGGHQENVNMCAVNINHGPDSSEWYTMSFEHVQEFRAQLKKEYKMDLYGNQGLWYEKINWFVEQGKYPIKKIIQKKGDIVISGPGTLHWVRSHGIALQSAWNLFPITLESLTYAYHRQQQNERIRFGKSNTIPLKSLTLKFLNHQPKQLTRQIQQLCVSKLKMWYKKEVQIYQNLLDQNTYKMGTEFPRKQKLSDIQGFCKKCLQQVLIYFVNGKVSNQIICLGCLTQTQKKKGRRVYMRHQLSDLQALIEYSQIGKSFQEIMSFCNGPFVGHDKIQCKYNHTAIEDQKIFIQKVNKMNQQLNNINEAQLQEWRQNIKRREKLHQEQEQQKQRDQNQNLQKEIIQTSNYNNDKKNNKIEEQKPKRIYNPVSKIYYSGQRTSSGWRNFQMPQDMTNVVTENKVDRILKLFEHQIYQMKKFRRQKNLPQPNFEHHIALNRNYIRPSNQSDHNGNNYSVQFKNNHYQQKGGSFQQRVNSDHKANFEPRGSFERRGNHHFDQYNRNHSQNYQKTHQRGKTFSTITPKQEEEQYQQYDNPNLKGDPVFSEDSQCENQKIKGTKKIHKNQEFPSLFEQIEKPEKQISRMELQYQNKSKHSSKHSEKHSNRDKYRNQSQKNSQKHSSKSQKKKQENKQFDKQKQQKSQKRSSKSSRKNDSKKKKKSQKHKKQSISGSESKQKKHKKRSDQKQKKSDSSSRKSRDQKEDKRRDNREQRQYKEQKESNRKNNQSWNRKDNEGNSNYKRSYEDRQENKDSDRKYYDNRQNGQTNYKGSSKYENRDEYDNKGDQNNERKRDSRYENQQTQHKSSYNNNYNSTDQGSNNQGYNNRRDGNNRGYNDHRDNNNTSNYNKNNGNNSNSNTNYDSNRFRNNNSNSFRQNNSNSFKNDNSRQNNNNNYGRDNYNKSSNNFQDKNQHNSQYKRKDEEGNKPKQNQDVDY